MKSLRTKVIAAGFIAASTATVCAFSLLGPYKAWQVERIGYDLPGDIGGPMTLSEGYRWNVPTITYAFDQSFVAYFGSNGMAAVDRAFDILHSVMTNGVSTITNDGFNLFVRGQPVPFDTRFVNFEAEALGLLDVKSTALSRLVEELGLAEPERYTWTLRSRTETGNNPRTTNYVVVKMNYDPISRQQSSFVNGTLYTYDIFEFQNPDVADAIERSVDPLAFSFTSVAGFNIFAGEFYSGLTHDDVGGLKWLYDTNNLATENLLPTITGGQPALGGSPWAPFLGTTNFFFIGTNFFFNTNLFGTNNLRVTGLRPGVNVVKFQKVFFDSVIGQTFVTMTNKFMDTTISNARPVIQPVERTIAQPDILFLAADLGLVQNLIPLLGARSGTQNWENNDDINGNADQDGPGVIRPQVRIFFSDQLPYFLNQTPIFLGEDTAFQSFIWGSFDGTTNAPIIFPAYGNLQLQDLRDFVVGRRGN